MKSLRPLAALLLLLCFSVPASAQSFNYAPPALGSTAKVMRDDLALELTGINTDKTDFVDIDTCAEIAAIIAGETGSCGSLVLSISPTLTTPNLGTPSVLNLTNATALGDSGIANDAVDGGSSGEIQDGTIDGEDVNSNLAGAGLVETSGSPDVIDINLNATGPGLAIASDTLSLLRSCGDGEILKWTLGTTSWGCAPDAGSGGGINNVSEDTSPTLGGNLEGAGFDLGTSGSQADDIFLAEGSVINFDAGDLTLTQTGNDLAIAGGTLTGPSVAAATDTSQGACELSTDAEAITGSATNRCVTPANLTAALGGASGVPPGVVSPYAGSSAPTGWLLADGSAVSRTTYSALFAITSTTYGVGDGSTTFNLPNLQSRIPVGSGTGTFSETQAAANFNTSDIITVTSNPMTGSTAKWVTGTKVQVTTSGVLPTGISAATNYFVRRLSATTLSLYDTYANAIAIGVTTGRVNITATGSGNHTMTASLSARTRGETFGAEDDVALMNHTHALTNYGSNTSGTAIEEPSNDGSTPEVTSSAGNTDEGVTNMPPSIVLNYIIKIRLVTPRGVVEKMIWL